MNQRPFLMVALLALVTFGATNTASAWIHGLPCRGAGYGGLSDGTYGGAWHAPYYHTMWGMPVAQVVPPTAEKQTHWGWGVGATHVTPIGPQFGVNYAVPGPYGPAAIYPTPAWPSSTDQFGVYYIRGPW